MDFVKQFNAKTGKEPEGMIIPGAGDHLQRPQLTFITENAARFRAAEARRGNR